jgi:hypothetical protein
MADLIQLRGGTAAQGTTANPVLAQREVGLETDTKKFKVGDGVTAWSTLPYWGTNVPTEFTQSSPAATWVVNHTLGYKPASISCFNGGGVEILGEVSHTNTAQFTVSFVRALAGTVLYV